MVNFSFQTMFRHNTYLPKARSIRLLNRGLKGTVHPQHKCPLCKSPSLAYLRMAIHSPQLSFVTEILDFVSLNFAHIIAAIFVELGGIACTFERFDVIV